MMKQKKYAYINTETARVELISVAGDTNVLTLLPPSVRDLIEIEDDAFEKLDDPDQDYFDALDIVDGELVLDLDVCKVMMTKVIRIYRNQRLQDLDFQQVLALGSANQEEVARIEAIKVKFRNVTHEIDMSSLTTLDQIRKVYPMVLEEA